MMPMHKAGLAIAAACMMTTATAAATPGTGLITSEVSAPGPEGPLGGAWLAASGDAPVMLIIPGSGPTDRDGNNPAGLAGASYRLLAEALAAKGISTVRVDKRGLFSSKAATANPYRATIGGYAEDAASWAKAMKQRSGRPCIWVAGHSEGGLVALAAAGSDDICGLVLISTAGRRLDVVMREQLAANPANAPILADANAAIDKLAKGEHADVSAMPPLLAKGLFNPAVQDYLIDLFAHDPAALIAKVDKPVLIVSGLADLQVSRQDAEALAAAQPGAKLELIEGMTHVLKQVAGEGRAANMATYTDPGLPIDAALVDAVAAFILAPPR